MASCDRKGRARVSVLIAMLRRDAVGCHRAEDALELVELFGLILARLLGALQRKYLRLVLVDHVAKSLPAPLTTNELTVLRECGGNVLPAAFVTFRNSATQYALVCHISAIGKSIRRSVQSAITDRYTRPRSDY